MKMRINRKFFQILILLFFAAFLFCFSGCDTGNDPFTSLLVSTDELAANADIKGLVIVDARGAGYSESHIPNAISMPFNNPSYVDDAVMLKPIADLQRQLSKQGLNRNMTFVVYDNTRASFGAAGRIFWMLEYLGCPNVHVLNGGWDEWIAEGRQTETKVTTLPPNIFVAQVNSDILSNKNYIQDRMSDDDFVVIDSREFYEYNGWTLYGESRGGHITGAYNLPYSWFFNDNNTIMDIQKLKDLFESRGITSDKEVTAYCTVGIRSGFIYFILRLLGYAKISNYDGSIAEWSADESLPMEKLPKYQRLVYPAWVDELISGGTPETYTGKGYVIMDCHWPDPAAYNAGHIPGAITVNPSYLSGGYYPEQNLAETNILPDDELKYAIESLGISHDTTVILYASNITTESWDFSNIGRIAWALMYAGVEDVRILEGGWQAWMKYGGAVETTANEPVLADFGAAVPSHPEYLITTSEVESLLNDPNGIVVGILYWEEWTGEMNWYDYLIPEMGHVPGSVWGRDESWYHWTPDGTLRCSTEIKKWWDETGITSDKTIAFYCGVGWRAGTLFYLADMLGYPNAKAWDDSIVGWVDSGHEVEQSAEE
jgi:thiosulfate/3-mercaptopyruvate sulfurtransferase